MKYEKIKSIILTLLVCISIFLTFNLWTYQPGYDTINSSETFDVSVGEKIDEPDLSKVLIKPYQLFYHSGTKTVGTLDGEEMDTVIKGLSSWTLFDLKDYSNQYSKDEIKSMIHGEKKVEIVFPDNVPFSIYNRVIHFEEKNIPTTSFDRIVIDLNTVNSDAGTIYFASLDSGKKYFYECRVNVESIQEFEKTFLKQVASYDEYIEQPLNSKKNIFLPRSPKEYKSYRFYADRLSLDDFKKALFSDPNNVEVDKNTFINVPSFMKTDEEYSTLSYINLSVDSDSSIPSASLLQKSMEFVNDHGGWTDDYHFFSSSSVENKIVYRLFMENHPVFNENQMAEVIQEWGNNSISKYERPYFTLDMVSKNAIRDVRLPSGASVLYALKKEGSKKLEDVEDIVVGYKMIRDTNESNKKFLIFEPSWYYKLSGNWIRVPLEELEGF
ncbi:two-component system activity regulator YycH [Rossellomorea aquimaris]|uniref:YycH family regulatory protein n=1 Tax=Rossellomorea aquimaris TaxID=189382 RepID=UPI001CD50674|nr:two-component system activity regulator YycH [Rossellomorea aquimaris]MCA1061091.1 two-component system activity regulator YycH [Rossellomorea aquimaris]